MRYINLILFFLVCNTTFCQTKISGKIPFPEISITYFKPFPGYVNYQLPSFTKTDKNGYFNISFNQDQPSIITIGLGNMQYELLIEPNDSLNLVVDENDFLTVKGNNAEGHNYMNLIFDVPRTKKVNELRSFFEKERSRPVDEFMALIKKDFAKKTFWLDSLVETNKVSLTYAEYMKYEILGVMAWDAGVLIGKYFPLNSSPHTVVKHKLLKKKLFELVDPENEKLLLTSGGEVYVTLTYLDDKYDDGSKADSSQIIIDDLPHLSAGPEKFRKYMWGNNLIFYLGFSPDKYDYCALLKKYKGIYGENEITHYLDDKNVCSPIQTAKKNPDIKILSNVIDVDFFSFLSHKFSNKRLYIDLWATWCSPCKMEFSVLPKEFHTLLKKHKIEPVYLSIDEENRNTAWEKLIQQLQLKGTHARLNQVLVKSVEDIIYDGKNISIPRYLIVNEQGKILSADAPRPSDPKIAQVFEQFFKQK